MKLAFSIFHWMPKLEWLVISDLCIISQVCYCKMNMNTSFYPTIQTILHLLPSSNK
jgi:hypothetical protein